MKDLIKIAAQKEDEEKATAMEKLFNYMFEQLMNIPEVRKKIARQLITGENISNEELEGYFKQIITR